MSEWQVIDTAPHWPANWEYLVGTWNGESWVKVEVWNPAWDRDSMKHRGATHVRLIGEPTPGSRKCRRCGEPLAADEEIDGCRDPDCPEQQP